MSFSSRHIDDPLWKCIIEQTFAHFLRFFYEDADAYFDFTKGFVYLDKEFETLYPPEDYNKGVRFVDKLIRVFRADGNEQFVLCHVEVQSSAGTEDLAKRMFRYFYRIYDKYNVPITALLILADDKGDYHPSVYRMDFLGTSLSYAFNSYKILAQEESALRNNSNPFAVVVLTALLALQNPNANDQELVALKLSLYEEMCKRSMDKQSRKAIYDFLSRYVRFNDQNMFIKFEETIASLKGRSTFMGTREYLLEQAKREGLEQGWEQGREQGIEQGREQGLEQGREQGLEQGRVQGLEQGREQGIEQGLEQGLKMTEDMKRSIAKAMQTMGLPPSAIAEATGLTEKEVRAL